MPQLARRAAVAADAARAESWVHCISVGVAELKGLGSIEVFDVFADREERTHVEILPRPY